ncbi:MAG TPA: hypothetical protein VHX87_10640 [Galbitalea sp.]|jgi:hypothetical protein|nr:hypothetical protein [Galbitalea sp.]
MTDPATPPAAPAPAPAAAGPKQTLSLVGFILGIVAVIFLWAPIFGLLVGIAAIIVSQMGHKREPAAPRWMSLIGLIAGIVGAAFSLLFTLFWIFALIAEASVLGTVGSLSGY